MPESTDIKLNIVCAFHQEAKPLIEQLKLNKDSEISAFDYYHNQHIGLIESGLGKQAASSAVGFLAGLQFPTSTAWLNIGIAGHPRAPVGEGLLAHKISDASTALNYYPDLSSHFSRHGVSCQSAELLTVDLAEEAYQVEAMIDMEAAGFFSSASRYSTLEFIHSYKVISDNKARPLQHFDKTQATELIHARLEDITSIIDVLTDRVEQYRSIYTTPKEYNVYTDALHFTKTQREQLKTLLFRWHLFTEDLATHTFAVSDYTNSKQLLSAMRQHLDEQVGR